MEVGIVLSVIGYENIDKIHFFHTFKYSISTFHPNEHLKIILIEVENTLTHKFFH